MLNYYFVVNPIGLLDQALQHTSECRQVIESLPAHYRKEPDSLYVLSLANCITGEVMTLQGQYVSSKV